MRRPLKKVANTTTVWDAIKDVGDRLRTEEAQDRARQEQAQNGQQGGAR